MRSLNLLAKVALTAALVAGLTACGKKKNGSKASTPGSSCSWNGAQQRYLDQNGNICNPGTGNNVCPQNGQYQNQYGQWASCVPGSNINGGYNPPGNYPYDPYPNQYTSGCSQYYYQYGVPYVPMIYQGQYVCVRYDLVQGYGYDTSYDDYGYNYWYAYPPYDSGGGGCGGSNVWIDLGSIGGNFCFGN
jgi:hypothetical protein